MLISNNLIPCCLSSFWITALHFKPGEAGTWAELAAHLALETLRSRDRPSKRTLVRLLLEMQAEGSRRLLSSDGQCWESCWPCIFKSRSPQGIQGSTPQHTLAVTLHEDPLLQEKYLVHRCPPTPERRAHGKYYQRHQTVSAQRSSRGRWPNFGVCLGNHTETSTQRTGQPGHAEGISTCSSCPGEAVSSRGMLDCHGA